MTDPASSSGDVHNANAELEERVFNGPDIAQRAIHSFRNDHELSSSRASAIYVLLLGYVIVSDLDKNSEMHLPLREISSWSVSPAFLTTTPWQRYSIDLETRAHGSVSLGGLLRSDAAVILSYLDASIS